VSEPTPRQEIVPYVPIAWPLGARTPLAAREVPLDVDMVQLLEQRQTRREFSDSVDDRTLGDLLWLACRSRSSWPSVYGPDQESRPHPSAGAMHSIHVLLCRASGPWWRYDPIEHALCELPETHANAASARRAASELINVGNGVVVALVAEPGKTEAKYTNADSLVWRDAGVVLGYLSVVAEALSLSFCPLGLTGDPHIANLLASSTALRGAGLAVLGR
jgi:SagB-type dehydrogenase family enzyme